jgi:hypothetical protein
MPESRFSNDWDYVLKDPKAPAKKQPPPPPPDPPNFKPLQLPTMPHDGSPNLPPTTNRMNPIDLFDLFLSIDTIQMLCDNTNENARRSRKAQLDERDANSEDTSTVRPWSDVTIPQMHGYLVCYH